MALGRIPFLVNRCLTNGGLKQWKLGDVTKLPQLTHAVRPMSTDKLYELRTYTVKVSNMKQFMTAAVDAMVVRKQHSKMLGYWLTEIGALNQVVHIWEYDGYEQRSKVRKALAADADWVKMAAPILTALECQTNAAVRLLPCSPTKEGGLFNGPVSFYKCTFPSATSAADMEGALKDFMTGVQAQCLGVWAQEVGPSPSTGYILFSAAPDMDSPDNPYIGDNPALKKLREKTVCIESKIMSPTPW